MYLLVDSLIFSSQQLSQWKSFQAVSPFDLLWLRIRNFINRIVFSEKKLIMNSTKNSNTQIEATLCLYCTFFMDYRLIIIKVNDLKGTMF